MQCLQTGQKVNQVSGTACMSGYAGGIPCVFPGIAAIASSSTLFQTRSDLSAAQCNKHHPAELQVEPESSSALVELAFVQEFVSTHVLASAGFGHHIRGGQRQKGVPVPAIR